MKQLIFASVCAAVLPILALAHSKVETSSPADGAVVTTVEVLELRFDHPIRITAMTLSGPGGVVVVDRETGTEPVTVFRAAPAEPLTVGDYHVDWRGLSTDGHPMQGTFRFTVSD